MVFNHDIILESLAIILLHLALWRGPMRKQGDFLPRDAMHKRGLSCHAVSVRPYVRHVRGSRQNE